MLVSFVQAVVACNVTAPRVCTLVLFIRKAITLSNTYISHCIECYILYGAKFSRGIIFAVSQIGFEL